MLESNKITKDNKNEPLLTEMNKNCQIFELGVGNTLLRGQGGYWFQGGADQTPGGFHSLSTESCGALYRFTKDLPKDKSKGKLKD